MPMRARRHREAVVDSPAQASHEQGFPLNWGGERTRRCRLSSQCWSSSPPLSRIAESAARLMSALADMNAAIAVDVPNVSNR